MRQRLPWHRNSLRVVGLGVRARRRGGMGHRRSLDGGPAAPARLREVALASSALDNLDAHQIHFGAIDLISDILALKLFRAYFGVPDSVAKAFLAHFLGPRGGPRRGSRRHAAAHTTRAD